MATERTESGASTTTCPGKATEAASSTPGEPFTSDDLERRIAVAQAAPIAPRIVADGPVKQRILKSDVNELAPNVRRILRLDEPAKLLEALEKLNA